MPFSLDIQMNELAFRPARLLERIELAPNYVRVRLHGEALQGFDSPGADDHIRLFFPGEAAAAPDSTEGWRALPSREYTPLSWDGERGILDVEFLLHGDGVASAWAASAEPGALIGVAGPRGSKVMTGMPEGWFLAGDETAVPAIRRFLELAGSEGRGTVLLEVADAAHELALDAPAGFAVEYLHRNGAPAGQALIARLESLTAADRPAADAFGFVAAEQSVVKPGRALLHQRWGLDAETTVVKGYWKAGTVEYHAPH